MTKTLKWTLLFSIFFMLLVTRAWAEDAMSELTSFGIEELMNIEVTIASKKPQKLTETAAAVFVITQEDIRRSGVTTIMDALRMAPGIEVAQSGSKVWAISARGLNGRFANKLLVLIDGRTVYQPLFSGVYWDIQETLLEDIDRIEIIRGPGASIWGANAVNGVINVITKNASETQGTLLTGGAGTEEKGFAGVRYGAKAGEDMSYRIYAKCFQRDASVLSSGDKAYDEWQGMSGGFRIDKNDSSQSFYTLQGDISYGEAEDSIIVPSTTAPFSNVHDSDYSFFGANILGRWTYTFSESSDMALQAYYDNSKRNPFTLGLNKNTFDMDFQHRFLLTSRHEIIWGLGYRHIHEPIDNSDVIITNEEFNSDLYSAFIQDNITLVHDKVFLMIGSKFEHNDASGFELQPSARLMWTPDHKSTVWGAVSRAVRTPSFIEGNGRINQTVLPDDTLFPGSPPAEIALVGNDNFDSEDLVAYEMGFRHLLTKKVSLDIATYFNQYDHLRTFEQGSMLCEPSGSPFPLCLPGDNIFIPLSAGNQMTGEIYGVELSSDVVVNDWWTLKPSYSYMKVQLHLDSNSTDTTSESAEGESPHHQFSLRSLMNLGNNIEMDAWLRYVDSLPAQNIDSYITLDLRLAWRPAKNLELSVVGQNLLDNSHAEFKPEIIDIASSEVQRSIYVKFVWNF
ncbi:MAG: TonB-dependent receptor [Syntrophales bacterium]